MTIRHPAVALLAAAALSLAACGGDDSTAGSGGLGVVATTTQVGDLARNVAGTRAAVSTILGPGADPHAFEPKPSDAEELVDAKLVLRSGGDLDEWLGDVLQNAGGDAEVVTLQDSVTVRREGGHAHEEDVETLNRESGAHVGEEHEDETMDPHWWQDPVNAVAAVSHIRDALVAADPGGRAEYTRNAARYTAQIRSADLAIGSCMNSVPEARRKLVTDHDALGYFADHYGIEVIGTVLPALSTQAQASAGETARLVETMRREGVSTVFPESGANTALQKTIAREAGGRIGPGLYADTLGAEGTAGATYLGALKANARAMLDAFGARGCRP